MQRLLRSPGVALWLVSLAPLHLTASPPWPQWRGPARDGHAPDITSPKQWPGKLTALWTFDVGEGYSGPVITESIVCAMGREGQDEVVVCCDRRTGKPIWRDRYAAPFTKSSYATRMAPGPYSTPVTDGSRLFTLGVNATLSAYRLDSGKLLWRSRPKRTPGTGGLFTGTAMSPLLDGSRLVVFWGDDREGELTALDADSGKALWVNGTDRPVYASPVVAQFSNTRQYVTLAEGSALGVDAATGKTLWKLPFKDQWNENIVTPVVAGDILLLGGVRKPTRAFRFAGGQPVELWSNPEVSFYMSTPVLLEGMLYGFQSKQKGQLVGLEVKTGARKMASEGRWAEHAHVVAAGDLILALTNAGELVVLDRSLREVTRYELSTSPTWAHPAVAPGMLVIKDETKVRAFRLP